MQLASSGLAGLGSSPPPELLKALQYNPLLYYSYYAQMLTALQAQHKLLEMNNSSSTNANINNNINNNNNNGSANNIKDILSPLKLGNMAALNKESNQVKNHLVDHNNNFILVWYFAHKYSLSTLCTSPSAPLLSLLEAYILLCTKCALCSQI